MRGYGLIIGLAISGSIIGFPSAGHAADFVVYGVYRGLDMGYPGEEPQKDFYVNIGTNQGVQDGATLEVIRKAATYDEISQKLYKDMSFPIATLKVIHAEASAAVARLEKVTPAESTPVISPRAVMVGDLVRKTP